jgi:hypothetical protein
MRNSPRRWLVRFAAAMTVAAGVTLVVATPAHAGSITGFQCQSWQAPVRRAGRAHPEPNGGRGERRVGSKQPFGEGHRTCQPGRLCAAEH